MENKHKLTQAEKCRLMLLAEVWISVITFAIFLLCVVLAQYLSLPEEQKVAIVLIALCPLIAGAVLGIVIEQKAGYYKCGKCNHLHKPGFSDVFWAPHIFRTRYIKCSQCGKKSWHKKVIE